MSTTSHNVERSAAVSAAASSAADSAAASSAAGSAAGARVGDPAAVPDIAADGFAGLEGAGLDEAIIAADHARVFHSWSAQAHLPSFSVAGGSGAELWNHAGERWLDFTSQLVNVNIGYQHPRVVAAICAQAQQLTTIAPSTSNDQRAIAAAKILDHAGPGFAKVFFTNAGADANENAIRLARLYTGRDKIISRYRSYHGNTAAAIGATGDWRRIGNEYARGHVHVFGPYLYRSRFWAQTPEQECARALEHLEATIAAEGPATVAGILLESVPGTAGVLVPPPGYLAGVRQICDRYGIVMIADEVMAGFGRTGSWFSFQSQKVTPDLVSFAKGVNSGYVPAGGVIICPQIAAAFDERVFPGGLTYSGHPLAMAAAVATMSAMEDEGIVDNAERVGREVIGPGLEKLTGNRLVGQVRGLGVFWAIEMVADKATRQPIAAERLARITAACKDNGLLVEAHDNRIHVVPPCVITADQATRGIQILTGAITDEAAR